MRPEDDIGAVVLAAGASRRFGEANKLLARVGERTLIGCVVDAIAAAGVGDIVVVIGWDHAATQSAAADPRVRIVHNPHWEAGMGSSIAVGIEALPDTTAGAFIVPADMPLHFAVELNFAGLPSGADDRYFHDGQGNRLGQLGRQLDLSDVQALNLVDEWLGIDVGLAINRQSGVWTFPVETVSQSEGGFELVHQSVAVYPHWLVKPDAFGRWSVTIQLTASAALAESRMQGALSQSQFASA